jgi:tetratricopeptide (TPR) repeat protein
MLVRIYRDAGRNTRLFCLGTIAATIAMLSYGLVDAELYATNMVLLVFLPVGCTMALHWSVRQHRRQNRDGFIVTPQLYSDSLLGGVGILPVMVIAALFLRPGSFASLHANLGAVAQTRTELSHYRPPAWSIQDELRRSNAVDLEPALYHYEAALRVDQGNLTAHSRLGQIALSRGDVETAYKHLRAAYLLDPEARTIGLLLGELYAVTGEVDQAATLWRTMGAGQEQLAERHWWYSHLGALQQAQWVADAIIQIR